MSATEDLLPGAAGLIDVGDAQLWVEERGTGERVVLSCASHVGRYPAILAGPPCDCHVYSIQARGYGRSTHMSGPPAIGWLDQWARDVLAVADHLGVDRFIYTGASHGAGIGWHLARASPERLRALVSVVGTPHDRAGDTSSSASRRRIVAGRRDRATVEEQFRIIAGAPASAEQAKIRERTIAEVVERTLNLSEEEAVINQGMPFPEARTNQELAEILAAIRVPVLILAGMRDGVVSPQSTLRAAASVPGAKAVLFEDEGHFVSRERPERLVPDVKLFLDQLEGQA